MAEPLLLQAKYRNGLEKRIGKQLSEAGVSFEYEPRKLPLAIPARKSSYLPDFVINNIIIETKGYFYDSAKDRQKLILIKEQHPDLDIRLVFSDASKSIYKGSPTTYGQWANDHGFKYSDKGVIPDEWIREMKSGKPASGTTLKSRKAAVGSGKEVGTNTGMAGRNCVESSGRRTGSRSR
jgi:hypothetical protein